VLSTQLSSLLALEYSHLHFEHVTAREPSKNDTAVFYGRTTATSKPGVDAVFF
jgi:hypothetical protein